MNMAETMKAFVFLGVGKVGIIEKPLPEPGPRDAVIRTTASFICTSETGLSLWARHAARLPPPWTGVVLDVRGTTNDPGAAMRAAVGTHPDVLFGPYGSSNTCHRPGCLEPRRRNLHALAPRVSTGNQCAFASFNLFYRSTPGCACH